MQYSDDNGNALLIVDLVCDSSATTPIISDYSYNGTTYTTTFTGAQACPLFTISALWEFLYQYRYYFGVALILIGLFLGLLGRKLWVVAIFLISAFLTMGIILLVFYTTFLKNTTADWVGWTVLGCSIIFGVILGLAMTKL
jgi:hypothetical protein